MSILLLIFIFVFFQVERNGFVGQLNGSVYGNSSFYMLCSSICADYIEIIEYFLMMVCWFSPCSVRTTVSAGFVCG